MNACCVCTHGISHTRRTHTQQMKQGMLGRPYGHGLPFVNLTGALRVRLVEGRR
jgi:hypothetical protein